MSKPPPEQSPNPQPGGAPYPQPGGAPYPGGGAPYPGGGAPYPGGGAPYPPSQGAPYPSQAPYGAPPPYMHVEQGGLQQPKVEGHVPQGPPPMQPQGPQTTYVVLNSNACPRCHVGILEEGIHPIGIVLAIVFYFFFLGPFSLFFLCWTCQKCTNCGWSA